MLDYVSGLVINMGKSYLTTAGSIGAEIEDQLRYILPKYAKICVDCCSPDGSKIQEMWESKYKQEIQTRIQRGWEIFTAIFEQEFILVGTQITTIKDAWTHAWNERSRSIAIKCTGTHITPYIN